MIDHLGIKVRDAARSRAFYEQALAPLGYKVLRVYEPTVGMGIDNKPDFWFSPGVEVGSLHLAFVSRTRAAVDAFHAAALAAGGLDNGAPGLRMHYHANYYGAFVIDPDGHNVEAVCHGPPPLPGTVKTSSKQKPVKKAAKTKTKTKTKKSAPAKRTQKRSKKR